MNVLLPKTTKPTKKQWLMYSIIIIICIISMVVAFYIQFYGRVDLFGIKEIGSFGSKTEDELVELEEGFNKLFKNQLNNEETEYNNRKEDENQPLIYNLYQISKSETDKYDINVSIPYINIKGEIVQSYNESIEENFVNECKRILSTSNKKNIYQVSYSATVEEGILSLIIQATLKEEDNAQQLIIKTYNYDLRNNKEISLAEILRIKKLDENKVQTKISETIKTNNQSAQSLISLGYSVFSRNVDDDMYKIENTTEFYLTNDALYMIYPYGNTQVTNEMDLIIF